MISLALTDVSRERTEAVSQVAAAGLALPDRSRTCSTTRSNVAGSAWNGAVDRLKPAAPWVAGVDVPAGPPEEEALGWPPEGAGAAEVAEGSAALTERPRRVGRTERGGVPLPEEPLACTGCLGMPKRSSLLGANSIIIVLKIVTFIQLSYLAFIIAAKLR